MRTNYFLFTTFTLLLSSIQIFSQATSAMESSGSLGEITGTIRNSETGHVVPNISIIVLKNGDLVTGAVADEKGKFKIQSIEAGTYDLKISGAEFQEKMNEDIVVFGNKTTLLDARLTEIDFLPQCRICTPKVEWSSKKLPEPRNLESSWIPTHILKQSLGF